MLIKDFLFKIGVFFTCFILFISTGFAYGEATSDTMGVTLLYPKEGEIINGTITIQWIALPGNLDIYLYYGLYHGSEWISINEEPLHNTDGYRGEYDWDTNTAKYGDEIYEILISTSGDGINHDSSGWFIINNYDEAPNVPATPKGPTTVKVGENYTYITSTTDPDADQVFYQFKWAEFNGISFVSDWFGPYDSGVEIEATHYWGAIFMNKTVMVVVKAKDTDEMESDWSDPLPVTVSKNKNRDLVLKKQFINYIECYLRFFPLMQLLWNILTR